MSDAYWHPSLRALAGTGAIAFDPSQELIWTGYPYTGRIESLFSANLLRYTAYKAHLPRTRPVGSADIKQLIVDERGVYSLSETGLHCASRRGLAAWSVPVDTHSLNAACLSSPRASDIVLAGQSFAPHGPGPDVLLVNAGTGTILRKTPCSDPITHLASTNSHVVSGTTAGRLNIHDPRQLQTTRPSLDGHIGGFSALAADSHLVFSAGFFLKLGRRVVDPMVKVYDMRMYRPLPPISFPSGPSFLCSYPRATSSVVVASASGHVSIIDSSNPAAAAFMQVDTASYLTAMAVAPTGEGLAFGDHDSVLHLFAASNEAVFVRQPSPIELPDPIEPVKHVDWTPDTPLNTIGLPHYNTRLLSWIDYEHFATPYTPLLRPPVPVDPIVLANMRMVDWVGYAPNPKTVLRNQAVPARTGVDATGRTDKRRMDTPMFRSERERKALAGDQSPVGGLASPDLEKTEGASSGALVPKYYRRVEIKYSKFGVDDFDFGFYNRTRFSGLETHIANSYTNALLQVLRFCWPFRKLAEGHTLQSCPKEHCLLCEAGFLFRMLRDAQGANCQTTNFARAFAANPSAIRLNLMDTEDSSTARTSYSTLVQTLNRFMIDCTSAESSQPEVALERPIIRSLSSTEATPVSQLFGVPMTTISTCGQCPMRIERASTAQVIDIVYPRKALSNEKPEATDFASILKASLARETSTKTTCQQCRQTAHLRVRRTLAEGGAMPPVLTINAGVNSPDRLGVWADTPTGDRFLLPRIAVGRKGDSWSVSTDGESTAAVYELQAIVAQIQLEGDPSHLVSFVRVPQDELPEATPSAWHLFNDFLVRSIPESEAMSFGGSWKIPAVLYYVRVDAEAVLDLSALPTQADPSILFNDLNISWRRDSVRHSVLKPDELPTRGTMISIDAEFVSLQQEDVEYRSDGTKKVLRPTRMSLARVSVLRGTGEETGVPFIDDHIHTSEPVVDFLTEFSGILPGDLDPETSRYTLVPLKMAYKKLRLLVDLGCVFIGHGLNKDFRIINIFVPRAQIVDTVDIYHLPARQRKLSLRFLAYVVLHQDIQGQTHDSIEDARTALQLYEKYSETHATGDWAALLDSIYDEGRKMGWKVPSSLRSPNTASPASLPPIALPRDRLVVPGEPSSSL